MLTYNLKRMSSTRKGITQGTAQYHVSSTFNHPKIPSLWKMSTFLVNTRNRLSRNLNSIPHLVRKNNPPSRTGVSFVRSVPLSFNIDLLLQYYNADITLEKETKTKDKKKTRRLNFSQEISSGVGLFGMFSVRFSRLPSVQAHLG